MATTYSFTGKWESLTTENFDQFMKTVGVCYVLRKAASLATVYYDINQNGDEWTFDYKIALKSGHLEFRLGEEFDELTPDGRKVKDVVTMVGDTLVWNQRGQPYDCITRRHLEAKGNILVEVATTNGVSCHRTYKRIA